MLSRHEAGVPTGARGRLGGFLSRRTQTCPDRIAARRGEVPPERARTIRQKGTFRRGGIAFQGRGRNVEVKAVAAAGMGLRPSVRLSRVRKRGPRTFGMTSPVRKRGPIATSQGVIAVAETTAHTVRLGSPN